MKVLIFLLLLLKSENEAAGSRVYARPKEESFDCSRRMMRVDWDQLVNYMLH